MLAFRDQSEFHGWRVGGHPSMVWIRAINSAGKEEEKKRGGRRERKTVACSNVLIVLARVEFPRRRVILGRGQSETKGRDLELSPLTFARVPGYFSTSLDNGEYSRRKTATRSFPGRQLSRNGENGTIRRVIISSGRRGLTEITCKGALDSRHLRSWLTFLPQVG